MTLIVLTTICLLSCAFYVYVMIHWIRETRRKRTIGPAASERAKESREPKHLLSIASGRASGRRDRFAARSQHPASVAMGSRGSNVRLWECERNAYETIARSLVLGRRF
jgi:hypothetical protein